METEELNVSLPRWCSDHLIEDKWFEDSMPPEERHLATPQASDSGHQEEASEG
jgi:hypothetical protein